MKNIKIKTSFFRYHCIPLIIYCLVLLFLDSSAFVTNCSNDGPFVQEVLDSYCKYLEDRGLSIATDDPNDISRAQLQQVSNCLTNSQKARIDEHLLNKFGSEVFKGEDTDPVVKSYMISIYKAYKHYFNNKR